MKTKTKLTVAIASVLSVVALAGTGYAGWVLSHNVSNKKEGNMTAYGVADKTVNLVINDFDNPKGIVWGKTAKDASLKHSWFGFTDDVDNEDFNPALNFTVSNTDSSDYAEPVIESATITVIDSAGVYKACLDSELITGPSTTTKEGEYVADIKAGIVPQSKEGQSNSFTYKLNFQSVVGTNLFGWGEKLGKRNPVNYYNAHSAEELVSPESKTTWFEDAKHKMGEIEKLNKLQFRIDLTVNHASL